ncbi:MAG: rod-binding protein [Alphaproteobacteria bacterium]|nr:rod-binding protein [Alphaproteobacteria bacterium]
MSLAVAPVEVKPLASLGTPLQTRQRDAARNAAEDFESVFVAQMMEPMFQGLKTDGMFGGGQGESVFRSLMIQEVGKEISKAGGIGISDAVYGEMLRMQGLRDEPIASPVQNAAASMRR